MKITEIERALHRAETVRDESLAAYWRKELERARKADEAREGQPGHAWTTGPYDRTCVRCGLVVRSLVIDTSRVRTTSDGAVLFDGGDAPLRPCEDGLVGEFATVRAAAPWERT